MSRILSRSTDPRSLRRSTLVALACVAVAVAFAAGCGNPADGKAEAEVSEPVAPAPAADAGTGVTYALTDASKIEWTGSKITGKHDGGFRSFVGAIELVDGDPARSRVSIEIDTTSIWSDNDRLTGHLKGADFFSVEEFPTSTFESTAIVKTPEGDGYDVTGNLDLHGVTKSITFPATIVVGDGSVTTTAEFFIQRYDFGIEYKGKPDDLINDEVVIRFDLTAEPAAAS